MKKLLSILCGGVIGVSAIGAGIVTVGGCNKKNSDDNKKETNARKLVKILETNNKAVALPWHLKGHDELSNFKPNNSDTKKNLVGAIGEFMTGYDAQPTIDEIVKGFVGDQKTLLDVIKFDDKSSNGSWIFGVQSLKFTIDLPKSDYYAKSTCSGTLQLRLSNTDPDDKKGQNLAAKVANGIAKEIKGKEINPLIVEDPTTLLTKWTSSGDVAEDIESQLDVLVGGIGNGEKLRGIIKTALGPKAPDKVKLGDYLRFISPAGMGYHGYQTKQSISDSKMLLMQIKVDADKSDLVGPLTTTKFVKESLVLSQFTKTRQLTVELEGKGPFDTDTEKVKKALCDAIVNEDQYNALNQGLVDKKKIVFTTKTLILNKDNEEKITFNGHPYTVWVKVTNPKT